MLFEIVTMINKSLTSEEAELIDAIRNLVKSYPNGYKELLYYTTKLFEEMIDLPK